MINLFFFIIFKYKVCFVLLYILFYYLCEGGCVINDKTRKIIGILSIAFIIGLFAIKGFPNLVGKSISDILPMLFTSMTVTCVKVGLLCGVVIIGKKVIKKISSNDDGKYVDVIDFEKENNAVIIEDKKNEQEKTIDNREIVNEEYDVLDKPKMLIKRK